MLHCLPFICFLVFQNRFASRILIFNRIDFNIITGHTSDHTSRGVHVFPVLPLPPLPNVGTKTFMKTVLPGDILFQHWGGEWKNNRRERLQVWDIRSQDFAFTCYTQHMHTWSPADERKALKHLCLFRLFFFEMLIFDTNFLKRFRMTKNGKSFYIAFQ